MVFSSTIFLFIFLPALLIIYFLAKSKYRNNILLFFSLLFYAWGEPIFVLIMIAEILVNWLIGLKIEKSSNASVRKICLLLAIFVDVGILLVYKYLMFFLENLNLIFNTSFIVPKIILPIGVSFFTFQILSYVIDLYNKTIKVQKSFFNLCLYVALFPQLVAGPIVRYSTIESQINERVINILTFSSGMKRFTVGLAKKILIANYMAIIADNIFYVNSINGEQAALTLWIGIVAYAFQIYFDFSGYSDMAIGLGKMFGFDFLENFNYPYIAKSVTEFWRRWHISLSTWFRDYVYIPLGGNRKGTCRTIFNLLIVWLLTGFWHGANWTFVAWGGIYFVALMVERLLGTTKSKSIFSQMWTILVVLFAWVFFRSANVCEALGYISGMFNFSNSLDSGTISYLMNSGYIFPIAMLFSTPFLEKILEKIQLLNPGGHKVISEIGYVIMFVVSILVCIKSSYNPFIYFNF